MSKDVTYIDNKDPNRSLSRYNNIKLFVGIEGYAVQETWDNPEIPERNDDTFHVVEAGEEYRPDLISLKYYSTSKLYWVIGVANNMIDPFAETTPGMRLRIPNRDYLFTTILIK